MDAIECGIVKLPRVPVADNSPGGENPKYRRPWEHISPKMPKIGRDKTAGSSSHVNFTTSKAARWQTDSRKRHINWVALDGNWEAGFCRIAESESHLIAYIKNQGGAWKSPAVRLPEPHLHPRFHHPHRRWPRPYDPLCQGQRI